MPVPVCGMIEATEVLGPRALTAANPGANPGLLFLLLGLLDPLEANHKPSYLATSYVTSSYPHSQNFIGQYLGHIRRTRAPSAPVQLRVELHRHPV